MTALRLRRLLDHDAPGLIAAAGIAVLSRWITGYLPDVVAEVTVALIFGIVVGQLTGPKDAFAVGVRFATQRVLRLAIVLLGARLSLDQVGAIGVPALALIVGTMSVAFLTVRIASRAFGVDGPLAMLLAVGAAVCGNSAVIATAPVIGARGRDVAYAVATVSLFGTAALLAYPMIGALLQMSSHSFGLWAGVAINDTSQVIAAGAAYSATSLDTATVVKLIRNSLMAPMLVAIAWTWHRTAQPSGGVVRAGIVQAIPLFVVGFLILAALRTMGIVEAGLAEWLDRVAQALILVALAAVGLSIRLRELLDTSLRPLAVGLCAAAFVGGAALYAIQALGLGRSLAPT